MVHSVAFSPDSRRLASGGADNTVFVTAVETGEVVRRIQPHASQNSLSVYSVAFSPDGRYIASGCADKTVVVTDIETGKMIGEPIVHHVHLRDDSKR